jgi:hypothetical protein
MRKETVSGDPRQAVTITLQASVLTQLKIMADKKGVPLSALVNSLLLRATRNRELN